MSGAHVPPHRWADAWAGRVSERDLAAMERHADECRACSRARSRVRRASDSFLSIRAQAAPELPWDGVRARTHWSVSSERRTRGRARARGPFLTRGRVALGVFAGGAVALAVVTGPASLDAPARRTAAPEVALPSVSPPATAPEAAALVGLVNRVSGEVMVDGLQHVDLFARELGAGTVLATGDGRIDVQFADGGGLALGPHGRLELRRFNAAEIELVVHGTVDLQVPHRAAHQQFRVIAGPRTVEVRGTQFRVRHDGAATSVACRRGAVAVHDAHGTVEVRASFRVDLAPGRAVGADRVIAMTEQELGVLADATPLVVGVPLDTLRHSSAPLELATATRREVRLDGVELGTAPLRVRVMLGRHTVEAADAAGRFRRAGWVDVEAPSAALSPARLELPAEPPRTPDVSERRRQFRTGIDQARLRQCMRQIAKQGLTGTYVQIELAVDATGAVNFLNIVDTDLGSATSTCVRDVLADVRFGPGAFASWRERIDL